jgi:TolB-like protein
MLLFFLGAGFPCLAQNAQPFDVAFTNMLNYLTGRISEGSTVAVLSFQSEYPNLSEYIIDDITSGLVNTDRYTVVDRRSLEILAQEMAFQLSGEVSDETALAIGRRLGAQTVISGAITYLGEFYRLRVQAIEVETARIQGSQTVTIQPNRLLATLAGIPWTGAPEPETPVVVVEPAPPPPAPPPARRSASVTKFLYLGLRGGVSARFYEPNGDLWQYSSTEDDIYYTGDFAVQTSMQLFKFLALQAEAVFSYPADSVGIQYWPDDFQRYALADHSLMMTVPVLGKLTFRPGLALLAGFGGVYFTVPLTGMTLHVNGMDYEYNIATPMPMGFIAGGNIGIRLGPATLFIDARYSRDFNDFEVEGEWGSRAVFKRRQQAVLSMGIEFGIGG